MQKPIGGRSKRGSAEKNGGVYSVLAVFLSNSMLETRKRAGEGVGKNDRYLSEVKTHVLLG